MNDHDIEIINRETSKDKIINFVKKNKVKIASIIFTFFIIVVVFFSYEIFLSKKKFNIADKFNNTVNQFNTGSNIDILEDMTAIIETREKTYSPLALYFLLDNNLITSKDDANRFFDIIINDLGLNQNLVMLNIYKKSLYNADDLIEAELLKMIAPVLKQDNIWQSHALYLIAEYYFSNGNKSKSLEYFNKIISNTNSNSEIKLEARKRIQRDFSE